MLQEMVRHPMDAAQALAALLGRVPGQEDVENPWAQQFRRDVEHLAKIMDHETDLGERMEGDLGRIFRHSLSQEFLQMDVTRIRHIFFMKQVFKGPREPRRRHRSRAKV